MVHACDLGSREAETERMLEAELRLRPTSGRREEGRGWWWRGKWRGAKEEERKDGREGCGGPPNK